METKKRNTVKPGTINKYGYQKQEDGSYKYVGKDGVRKLAAPVGYINKYGRQKQPDGSYKYVGRKAFRHNEDSVAYKRALEKIQELPAHEELLALSGPVPVQFIDKWGHKREGFAIGYEKADTGLVAKIVGQKSEWEVEVEKTSVLV